MAQQQPRSGVKYLGVVITSLGATLVAIGMLLVPLPGPGFVIMFLSFPILVLGLLIGWFGRSDEEDEQTHSG